MEQVSSPFTVLIPRVGAFLAHDGVPIGGIAVGMMLGSYALLGIVPSVPLLTLAFCGTALVYQLDRGLDFSPEDRFNRPAYGAWRRAHRDYVRGTVLLCTVVGIGMLPFLRPVTIAAGLGLGLVGLLHVIPVLGPRRRLKTFAWLKPLSISAVWALGGVLLPVLEADRSITVGVAALAGYRFVIVLVNTLLADWGDRDGDARANLQTLATEWSSPTLFYVVRGLLLTTLAAGLIVTAGYRLPLLLVDLGGLLAMFVLVRGSETGLTRARRVAIDAVVAWPAVTALVAWLVGPG